MKGPVKIYIPLYPNYDLAGFHLADEWMPDQLKECDNVEYICKDALMELINKKLKESADRLDYKTNKAYSEIFDELNKM